MPAAQTSPKSDRLSSEAVLGILSSFPRKPINTGHWICIIWSPKVGDMAPTRKGCESGKSGQCWVYGNQVRFSPKEDLMQGKLEHAPKLPKGINTTSWAPKEEDQSIHSSKSRRHEGEAPGGSQRLPQVLVAVVALHGEAWWSFRAHALIPSSQLYILHSMVI
jgi:hypothetical protein